MNCHLRDVWYAVRLSGALSELEAQGEVPLTYFEFGTLAALWLSADLFNLYVTLELLSLVAVALVSLDGLRRTGLIAPGIVLNKDGSFQRTARFRGGRTGCNSRNPRGSRRS